MSIVETNKIDIVGTRPGSRLVRLVIADHLDWTEFKKHATLLEAKVNTYLEFIESGQMHHMTNPPIPTEPQVEILLAAKHAPTEEAEKFLEKVASFLQQAGISFKVQVQTA